ncbi:MAG TPA: hypothetical protein GX719_01105 [Gammaproteobacteria bacterium]|nr:hypothetical protein [Gammaproteobacteria bacterium]
MLLGIVEKYWAQRVAIDAELFKVLAAEAQNLEHVVLQLDTALCDLGLATDKAEERSIAQRCQGALGLLRRQIICLGAQITLVVMAAIALAWLP